MKKIFYFAVLAIFILGCNKAPQEVIRPVEYIKIQTQNSLINKEFFGYLKASSLVDLSFQISGVLKDVYVSEGQVLKKGELIARLDSELYQIEQEELNYALKNAQVEFEGAKDYYTRIEKLHKAGGISDNDYENAQVKMQSAKYKIEIAKQRLKYKNQQTSYDRILAPTDGLVVKKIASVGQYLRSGESVVQFQNLNNVEAYIFVSQEYVNSLSLGQRAKVKVGAKNKIYNGKIKEISATSLDGVSYRVKIIIEEQNNDLKDGMSASAVFELSSQSAKIKIPLNSILEEDKDNFVFKIINTQGGFGQIQKQKVFLGEIEGNSIEVQNGLLEGDLVVTKGANEVQEGQKVRYEY